MNAYSSKARIPMNHRSDRTYSLNQIALEAMADYGFEAEFPKAAIEQAAHSVNRSGIPPMASRDTSILSFAIRDSG
jgi:hypothetical protein